MGSLNSYHNRFTVKRPKRLRVYHPYPCDIWTFKMFVWQLTVQICWRLIGKVSPNKNIRVTVARGLVSKGLKENREGWIHCYGFTRKFSCVTAGGVLSHLVYPGRVPLPVWTPDRTWYQRRGPPRRDLGPWMDKQTENTTFPHSSYAGG